MSDIFILIGLCFLLRLTIPSVPPTYLGRDSKWKDYVGYEDDKHVVGYIAQEVKNVFPKAVTESKNVLKKKNENGEIVEEEIEDFLTLNVDQIQKTLHGAIQKLMNVVEQQQTDIETQQKRIDELQQRLSDVEQRR